MNRSIKSTAAAANTAKPAAKPAIAQTKVAKAIPHEEVKADVASDDSVFAEAAKRYQDAQDYLLKFFKAPSWKRTLVAFVTSFLIGYGIGTVAAAILDWMMVGAVAMAVPTFISVIVYILGVLLTIRFAWKVGARVGGAILTGEADERALAAYDAVKGTLARLNPFGKRTVAAA